MSPRSDSDSQEWTQVTRHMRKSVKRQTSLREDIGPTPNPQYTVQDLKIAREKARQIWRGEDVRTCLQGLIRTQMTRHPKKISQAVCLGLGTVEMPGAEVRAQYTVFTQLEAFLDIVATMEETQNQKIKLYFQDPKFSLAEEKHLEDMGHAVLTNPQAFSTINKETFFYAPHLEWQPYLDGIASGPPAVVMGNSLDFITDAWSTEVLDTDKLVGGIEFGRNSKRIAVPNYQYMVDGFIYWNIGGGAVEYNS
ncbi:uncharacterized protein MKZ38_004069 [Zalerion maritima]|uniref:SRR1-like domain-containing protein n=1 Tax=Zalerion maritima TaxID=339359 RepID=A0AAD5RY14_9PEZI|nr:uncharacterized protein MKZ38_004069 [Zalerion maritima]